MIKDLFLSVLNMTVTASVAIIAVILIRLILKKAPKIYSYALWSVVLFRLLCPYSLPLNISVYNALPAAQDENGRIYYDIPDAIKSDAIETDNIIINDNIVADIKSETNPNDNTIVEKPAQNNVIPQHNVLVVSTEEKPDYSFFFSLIWIIGIFYIALQNIINYRETKSVLAVSRFVKDNIYENDLIPTAFITGIISPKIYIPAGLTQEQQNYVILHEQIHLKRKDYIFKLLGFVALCIHWFNPLVWIAFTLFEKDMEMSCDEAVIKNLSKAGKVAYSLTLLSISAQKSISATAIAFSEGNTKNRIQNVLEYIKPSVKYIVSATVLIVVAVVILISNPTGNSVYKTAVGDINADECVVICDEDYNHFAGESYKQLTKQLNKIKISPDVEGAPDEIPPKYTLSFLQGDCVVKVKFDENAEYMIKEIPTDNGVETVIYAIKNSDDLEVLLNEVLTNETIVLNNNIRLTFPAFEMSDKKAEEVQPFNLTFVAPEYWHIKERGYITPPAFHNTVEIFDKLNSCTGNISFVTYEKDYSSSTEMFDDLFASSGYVEMSRMINRDNVEVLKIQHEQITSVLIDNKQLKTCVFVHLYHPYNKPEIIEKIVETIDIQPCDGFEIKAFDNRVKFWVKPDETRENIALTAAQKYRDTFSSQYKYSLKDAKIISKEEADLLINASIIDLMGEDYKYCILATYDFLDPFTELTKLYGSQFYILIDECLSDGQENYVVTGGSYNNGLLSSVPLVESEFIETEVISVTPHKTQVVRDDTKALGTSEVLRTGKNGLVKQKVRRELVNGIIVKQQIVETTVIEPAVDKVISQGRLYNGEIISNNDDGLAWPTAGGRVSRGFTGQYPRHHGIDIAASVGTHIYAAADGVVTRALYTNRGYGRYIIIEHGGYQTLYAHCSELLVGVGDSVQKGQLIAEMGSSGNSTGPHLHFEVKNANYRYDPYRWF